MNYNARMQCFEQITSCRTQQRVHEREMESQAASYVVTIPVDNATTRGLTTTSNEESVDTNICIHAGTY